MIETLTLTLGLASIIVLVWWCCEFLWDLLHKPKRPLYKGDLNNLRWECSYNAPIRVVLVECGCGGNATLYAPSLTGRCYKCNAIYQVGEISADGVIRLKDITHEQ